VTDRAAAAQKEQDRQAEYERKALAVQAAEVELQNEKARNEAQHAEDMKRRALDADKKAAELEAAAKAAEQRKLDIEVRDRAKERERVAAAEREKAAAAVIVAASVPVPSDSMQMKCEAGFVIKSANAEGKKVFMNICGHENVQQTTASALNKYVNNTSTSGARGFLTFDKVTIDDNTIAYDIVINKGILQECMVEAPDGRMNSNSIKPLVCETAIKLARETYHEVLEENYKLPKIRSGYKGLTSLPSPRIVPKDIFSPRAVPKRTSGSTSGSTSVSSTGSTGVTDSIAVPTSTTNNNTNNNGTNKPLSKPHRLNPDDVPYQHHLKSGESILANALVNKPNPIGLEHKRQF